MALSRGAVCLYLGSKESLHGISVALSGFEFGDTITVLSKHEKFDEYDNREKKGRYKVRYKYKGNGLYINGYVYGNRLKQIAHDRSLKGDKK